MPNWVEAGRHLLGIRGQGTQGGRRNRAGVSPQGHQTRAQPAHWASVWWPQVIWMMCWDQWPWSSAPLSHLVHAVQGNRRSGISSAHQADPHVAESRRLSHEGAAWLGGTCSAGKNLSSVCFSGSTAWVYACVQWIHPRTPWQFCDATRTGQWSLAWRGSVYRSSVCKPSLEDKWISTILQLSLHLLHHWLCQWLWQLTDKPCGFYHYLIKYNPKLTDLWLTTKSEPVSCVQLCNSINYSPPHSSLHGIIRQEHWSELPFPTPGDLPDPGIEAASPVSPTLQADALPVEPLGEASWFRHIH